MKTKNNGSYILPIVVIAAAFVGFYFVVISSNRIGTVSRTNEYLDIKFVIIGILLMVPLVIYLYTLKPTPKTKLRGNKRRQGNGLMSNYGRSKKKAVKAYNIYVKNESGGSLIVNRKSVLDNDQWHIFQLKFHRALYFSNGIVVEVGADEEGIEIDDFRDQVIVLEDEDYRTYDIPDDVEFAFIISERNDSEIVE